MVDLRSDTVTKPTDAMRKAMSIAEVGDDVYGDDVTVNRLEEITADILGKEDAMFVPSGTMGNLISLMTHTSPGQEIILGRQAHIHLFEVSGYARLCGLGVKIVDDTMGIFDANEIEEKVIKGFNIHNGGTGLVCMENTHNVAGGIVADTGHMKKVRKVADKYDLPIHLDGARLFNAATYLKTDIKKLAEDADSVMLCLAKGLAAPVGSMIAGKKEFVKKARHNRKMLGGGMRQAGILAAAGIIAITEMTDRLEEDHSNARKLAEGLADIDGFEIDLDKVQTNIVMVRVNKKGTDAFGVYEALKTDGIHTSPFDSKRLRLTTNYHITEKDVLYTLDKISML